MFTLVPIFEHLHELIVIMISISQTNPPYWPTEKKPTQTYGPIEVTLVKTNYGNKLDTIITRDFNVKNKSQVSKAYWVIMEIL